MSNANRYTVLGFGEKYIAPVDKRPRPPGDAPVGRSLADARALLAPKVSQVLTTITDMASERRLEEVVLELRLDDKFLAKSYSPEELLKAAGLSVRGTGTWTQYAPVRGRRKNGAAKAIAPDRLEARKSRAIYVSGTNESLLRLQGIVDDASAEDITKLEDIRLPDVADRLRLSSDDAAEARALEIVLFNWQNSLRKDAIQRVLNLLERSGIPESKRRIKEYDNGPTFIGAVVSNNVIEQLGHYNFLRSARALHRINLTKDVVRHAFSSVTGPTQTVRPETRIAIFDGGYAGGHPLLDPYVESVALTPQPPDERCVEHGMMVASAAVYGPFDGTGAVPAPACRVLAYRILPDPLDDHLELYGAIDAIEAQVSKLPSDIKVVNLSFGPRGPIDEVPSRFTYAIDRMARGTGKLFVTAVGNDGDRAGEERIQAPADAVNNLGIGAFRLDSKGQAEHARYSCQGPGRSGAIRKPDVLGFGGCEARPFYALVPDPTQVGATSGTSFAAPVVSSLAGRVAALVEAPADLSAEALRALVVHSARPIDGAPISHTGYGTVAASVQEVLACSPTRVSVLYQGIVSPRDSWKLPFFVPTDFSPGGKLDLTWTVVTSPEVDESSPDEYTLAGIEIAFRPHSDNYRFTQPEHLGRKSKLLNVHSAAVECARLLDEGWKQSALPVSDSNQGQSERELRARDGKWESVLHDDRRKNPKSVSEPMLTISVLGRGTWDRKSPDLKARFAAVLTVDAPKYNGDLYAEVVAAFTKLRPLTVREQSRGTGRLRT